MPRKAILKFNNEVIYPRTSLDNLVEVYGSTTTVGVPTLDPETGWIESKYLPSYVDDIVELKSITTAPATAAVGDLYYNSTSKKIFTATSANTWGETGVDPEKSKIYVDVTTDKIYRYGGSDSGMVEISKQISTVTTIRAVDSASDGVVPTEKAVAVALASVAVAGHTHAISDVNGLQDALDGKQGTLSEGEGINISNDTISIRAADSAGSNAKKGGVIVDTTVSKGISITNNSGTIAASASAATKSADGFGVVAIGDNIDVSNGTISVAAASTSAPGVTQLEGNIGTANGTALNNPPTTDAVKTYVAAQILAGVTCELL